MGFVQGAGGGDINLSFDDEDRLLGKEKLSLAEIVQIYNTSYIDSGKVASSVDTMKETLDQTMDTVLNNTRDIFTIMKGTDSDRIYSGPEAEAHQTEMSEIVSNLATIVSPIEILSQFAEADANDYNSKLDQLTEKAKRQQLCEMLDKINACAKNGDTTYSYHRGGLLFNYLWEGKPKAGFTDLGNLTANYVIVYPYEPDTVGWHYSDYYLAYYNYGNDSLATMEANVEKMSEEISSIQLPYDKEVRDPNPSSSASNKHAGGGHSGHI